MNNGAVFLIGELAASRVIGRTTFEKAGANAAQDDAPMEIRAIAVEEVENFIVVTNEYFIGVYCENKTVGNEIKKYGLFPDCWSD